MYEVVKRIFDIFVVLVLSPFWLPLIILLSLLVKLTSPGRIFFTQKRYGKNKSFFMIYKFRSMYSDAPKDVPTHLLADPQAFITPVGKFLRKLSLDELPQVLNILKGELSLVGPRPALWNQDDLIAARDQNNANGVPVGLTGLAQVMGRDELPIDVKAAYDGEYVKKAGFFFDLWILILTVWVTLSRRGFKEGKNGN